jgi:hypothetical protein
MFNESSGMFIFIESLASLIVVVYAIISEL